MMKRTTTLLLQAAILVVATLNVSAANLTFKRVSVHDPSVVYDASTQRYYIFGSHRGAAVSKDLMNWSTFKAPWGTLKDDGTFASRNIVDAKAFVTNYTKTVTIGGKEVAFGNLNVHDWSAAVNGDKGEVWSIGGNMWAPDVIYNKKMEKWCMYLSINGYKWNSSIILLTADKPTGPYVYQGPVIFSGFNVFPDNAAISYKNTDLELVIGTQKSLPSRYNMGTKWGDRWPHCIDPCVFYDEQGQLWMSYGSWSGGIWILRLNEDNGLRDYDVKYGVAGSGNGVTGDPYFGKKIAGGFYSSGEGSYIEYIGGYYFLFVSNGGLASGGDPGDYNNGGYQMRVFRSANPNGPYSDASNKSAVLSGYEMNFGPKSTVNRGVNIFGAYGDWGNMIVNDGERSQGHNSIIAAEDGRTYLVYHSRFQNGGEGHQVRVHQVYQNQAGWLVAAPFEYTGEETTSEDIATQQPFDNAQIPGTYHLLVHKYGLDHTKKELVKPVDIQLNDDGTVSGSYKGKWTTVSGTAYITITLAGTAYKGVLVEQTLEPKTDKTIAFTALANNGVTVWGYREGGIPEVPTAIADVTAAAPRQTPLFDLQGRRLSSHRSPLGKGIYIKDGRKFAVK